MRSHLPAAAPDGTARHQMSPHLLVCRVAALAATILLAASAPAGAAMAGMAMPDDPAPAAAGNAGFAVKLGDLSISKGFVRAMLPGQPTGGGYFTVSDAGKTADTLLGASSPIAGSVTLHEMKMNGDVMEMRALPQGIPVPAGGTVKLAPNGFHLMFERVTVPFKLTDMVPVTLTFAKAGKVDIVLPVAPLGAAGPAN
jgi:copper(I)-binding protein